MRRTLDYTILAGLAHAPRSGYELTKWLARVASHFWPVSHSSIYPALAGLEASGLVTHQTTPSEQGPERKVYTLTQQGDAELMAWVDGSVAPAQTRDEQLVRALCYGFLPRERALAQLERVRRYHTDRLQHYHDLEQLLRSGPDPHDEGHAISGPAFTGTLLVIRRGILSERGYLAWCDEAAAIIRAAEAPHPGSPEGT